MSRTPCFRASWIAAGAIVWLALGCGRGPSPNLSPVASDPEEIAAARRWAEARAEAARAEEARYVGRGGSGAE